MSCTPCSSFDRCCGFPIGSPRWTNRASTALADGLARLALAVSRLDDWIDRFFIDGLVNGIARRTYAVGLRLRPFRPATCGST